MKYGSKKGAMPAKKAPKNPGNGGNKGTPPMRYAKDASVKESRAKKFS